MIVVTHQFVYAIIVVLIFTKYVHYRISNSTDHKSLVNVSDLFSSHRWSVAKYNLSDTLHYLAPRFYATLVRLITS